MASNKTLEVLCLNGRRQKVKTTPSTTILQVLQDVCKKQGFEDREVDLIHQRKVLDVTATIRYTNIPNNGKLEMVKRNFARKASNVNIAIQTDFGERLQCQFSPSTTLFDVLKQLEGDPGSMHHGKMLYKVPVIIYMTHKISGTKCLQETTLENLGLIAGNAVLRLVHEESEDDKVKEEFTGEKFSSPAVDDASLIEKDLHNTSTKSCNSKESIMEEIPKDDAPSIGVEKERRASEDITEPLTKRPKLPETASREKTDVVPKPIPHTITDEDILRVSAATHPFPQFKFPETAPQAVDEDTIEAVDPKQIMKEERLSMPCDRRACVFNFNNVESKITNREDPDDSFYEPTIEDLRLRIQALKSVASDDAPLTTKNMRAAKNMEKAFQYKQVVIRIQFPGRIILQGVFRPLEKVKAIKDFIKEHLQNKDEKFDLYTTPPKCVLKKLDQTLHDANLIPTALVHVSCDKNIENLLKADLLDASVAFTEAEKLAYDISKRRPSHAASSTPPLNDKNVQELPETSSEREPAPAKFMQSKTAKPPSSKAPTWFKAGKR